MSEKIESVAVELVRKHRFIVTLGSGGVGKTTSAVALAVLGAMEGKKVGLLSIDPAKRLAQAMGISLGSSLTEVKLPVPGIKGSLYGAMLDQKAVFDEMVERWTPNEKVRNKIYENSIYKEVSENLGGPLEYMALAKLQAMSEDKSFDLIVLDTPPDSHALDFLERPNALSGFTEGGVMTWLIKPFHLAQRMGAGKIFKAGGKLMSGISSVTGVKMLQMLAEFLVLMEDVIKGFSQAGMEIQSILKSEHTTFVLVAAPHNAAIRSGEGLVRELKSKGFPLGGVFLNRFTPTDLIESLDRVESQGVMLPGKDILHTKIKKTEQLARHLKEYISQNFDEKSPIVKIEEYKQFIHSLDSVIGFSNALASSETL